MPTFISNHYPIEDQDCDDDSASTATPAEKCDPPGGDHPHSDDPGCDDRGRATAAPPPTSSPPPPGVLRAFMADDVGSEGSTRPSGESSRAATPPPRTLSSLPIPSPATPRPSNP